MSVAYYLGMKAIGERLGYKNYKSIMRMHIQQGLPIYKRNQPLPQGGYSCMWCISEAALVAWEVMQGQKSTQAWRRRREEQEERRQHALTA